MRRRARGVRCSDLEVSFSMDPLQVFVIKSVFRILLCFILINYEGKSFTCNRGGFGLLNMVNADVRYIGKR